MDEFSIKFREHARFWWMIVAVNWAVHSTVDESGYSPSQWVLGRGNKIPYNLLSQSSRLSLHSRHVTDRSFAESRYDGGGSTGCFRLTVLQGFLSSYSR